MAFTDGFDVYDDGEFDEAMAEEETAVEYCSRIPGRKSCHIYGHTQWCEGGREIFQGGYAWLTVGPLRHLDVELARERAADEEQAMRELDARDCRNINFYDGGDFNYGRGR